MRQKRQRPCKIVKILLKRERKKQTKQFNILYFKLWNMLFFHCSQFSVHLHFIFLFLLILHFFSILFFIQFFLYFFHFSSYFNFSQTFARKTRNFQREMNKYYICLHYISIRCVFSTFRNVFCSTSQYVCE